MADRHVPASIDELVARWDRFITSTIYRVSGGHVRVDDLPDLKQSVYLRVIETDYLARCRALIGERGGSFSTYLFMLTRSVLVNIFAKNTRNPLNTAVGIVEHAPGLDALGEESTGALVLETLNDLVDDRFERQFEAAEWLDRFEQHLKTVRKPFGPLVTLPDGTQERRSLALVFRLYRRYKVDGAGWPQEIANVLGTGTGPVFANMRKIRAEAATFRGKQIAA